MKLVSAFHIQPNNNLKVQDYEVFKDKKELENLKNKIIERISDTLDTKNINSDIINQSIEYNTQDMSLSNIEKNYLFNLIDNEINGYGPITEIVQDKAVKTIMVNSCNSIYIETEVGIIKEDNVSFINDEHILRTIKKFIAPLNIDMNFTSLNTKLKDGSKLEVVLPPITKNPVFMIKKYNQNIATMEELIRLGTLTTDMANYLDQAIKERKNILVVGPNDVGKSNLLNALGQIIKDNLRIITIDSNSNLNIAKEHVVNLNDALHSNLFDVAKNLKADYLFISDIDQSNLMEVLNLLNTNKGIITSMNASAQNILESLEARIVINTHNIPDEWLREYLKNSIDLVVVLEKVDATKRKVTSIKVFNNHNLEDVFTYRNNEFIAQNKKSIFDLGE